MKLCNSWWFASATSWSGPGHMPCRSSPGSVHAQWTQSPGTLSNWDNLQTSRSRSPRFHGLVVMTVPRRGQWESSSSEKWPRHLNPHRLSAGHAVLLCTWFLKRLFAPLDSRHLELYLVHHTSLGFSIYLGTQLTTKKWLCNEWQISPLSNPIQRQGSTRMPSLPPPPPPIFIMF